MNFNYSDKICEYCNKKAKMVTGEKIHPHRPDLYTLNFWRCDPCDASVGCAPGTITPLGRMANAELKKEKQLAHQAFDTIWKSGKIRRTQAYNLLSKKLGISVHDCHIGMFDKTMCQKVVELSKEF
jgi:hypothetical protein